MASRAGRLRNERHAEALLTAIVTAPDAAVADAKPVEHCRGRIGGYEIQWRFVFLAESPRSAMGKILKTELRQRYAGSSAAQAPVN